GQSDPTHHTLNQSHPTMRNTVRPGRQLVPDVATTKHRPTFVHYDGSLQSLFDLPLLMRYSLTYDLLHSKSLFSRFCRSSTRQLPQEGSVKCNITKSRLKRDIR